MRDAAKVIDLDGLKHVNDQIVKKAVKNKVYDKGTIDGYTVNSIIFPEEIWTVLSSLAATRKSVQIV